MNRFTTTILLTLLALISFDVHSQSDSIFIRKIFTEELVNGKSYENLRYLCKEIGPRLTGSENAGKAALWVKKELESYGLDSVWLQPVTVPKWVRGAEESANILSKNGKIAVNVTALGNSEGSGKKGVKGEVVEVLSLEDLESRSQDDIKGKIVFINEKMDLSLIKTGDMYSKAGVIRYQGPREASKLGAIGVVVRSLSPSTDDYPHTGSQDYGMNVRKIPAIAISTKDADLLSQQIKQEPGLQFYFRTFSHMEEDVLSYNVIGQITGNEYPDEIIVFGGHLDSWDLAEGAHDDGAGSIHAIETIRLLKENYQPKRTLRVVLFMNEENGLKGGKEYARVAEEKGEKHIAALESDSGGFLPQGFSMDASVPVLEKIQSWSPHFAPYRLFLFEKGYGGADIGPLKLQNVPLIGLEVSDQRYFEMHHSALDKFEIVNRRELELGCASMASMVYLIDKYGLE